MGMDIEEHYDKVYRYCYFKLKNRHLAEDITQEAFLRFLECSSYREAGRPLAFLYTVARNLCIDEFRRREKERVTVPAEEDSVKYGDGDGRKELPGLAVPSFEQKVVENLLLQQVLSELTEEQRELVLLRFVNELPMDILSRLYGKSRFALYRELKQLTKFLERRISDEK